MGVDAGKQILTWISFLASLATLILLAITAIVGSGQLAALREATRVEQITQLGVSLGADTMSTRVAAIYGMKEYTIAYPDTRSDVLRILAAHTRIASDYELNVTVRALSEVSSLRNPHDQPLKIDLAKLPLAEQPMAQLTAENSYFAGTDFRNADLSRARWTCVNAGEAGPGESGADFREATLDGAVLRRVNLSSTTFEGASVDDVKFEEIYWDVEPDWPTDPDFRRPAQAGNSDSYLRACET